MLMMMTLICIYKKNKNKKKEEESINWHYNPKYECIAKIIYIQIKTFLSYKIQILKRKILSSGPPLPSGFNI